jgi:hypothetical protein
MTAIFTDRAATSPRGKTRDLQPDNHKPHEVQFAGFPANRVILLFRVSNQSYPNVTRFIDALCLKPLLWAKVRATVAIPINGRADWRSREASPDSAKQSTLIVCAGQ